MSLEFQVKLGQSTNLLTGYKDDVYSVPIIRSLKPALFEREAVVKNPDYDAKWSSPVITLHHNVEDLLSAIFQVKLRSIMLDGKPSEGGAQSVWPSGALMLAGLSDIERKKALEHVSTQLGIDLSHESWSYALARRTRQIGTATHHCYERGIFGNPDPDNTLKPDVFEALKKLEKLQKTSTDVNVNGAKGYLHFYETYGSHFVSSVVAGDSIFQVFAFPVPAFENILRSYKKFPQDFSGDLSYSFVIFTVPRSKDGKIGYATAAGNICIASEDDEMARSLRDGLWRDESYSGTNSIFAPYLRQGAVDINATFNKIVPISVELASLSVFAEYYRMLIWHRVFKAAMYVKYLHGSGVAPYFSNNCPYDLDSMFQDSDPNGDDGFLSTLCTPFVNIMQEKVDLSTMVVKFPEVVTEFSVFANAIQTAFVEGPPTVEVPQPSTSTNITFVEGLSTGEEPQPSTSMKRKEIPSSRPNEKTAIGVPGTCNVTIFGHVITSGGGAPLPPNVHLADSALEDIKNRLVCGEFYGALRLSNSNNTKSYVIMNGLMLEYSDGHVNVVRDVRESPSLNIVIERRTDMQFALVAAEARLNFLLANPSNHEKGIDLLKHFLLWLGKVAESDNDLVPLQARAMYLAKVTASTQRSGVLVPLLRYEAYKDVVHNVQDVIKTASNKLTNAQNQVRERMAEEREIDREQAINENIIKSGQLLHHYIVSQASYQESLENMFQSVFNEKETEMNNAVNETKKLKSRLNEQRTVVDQAIVDYEDAVAEWKEKEMLKAGIDIASGIFSLAFVVITPSSSIESLKTLGETAQKIQKLVNVFDAVIKVYRAFKELPNDPKKVVETLADVGPGGLVTPSLLEWDEMHVHFEAVLSTGPDVPAKTSLSAAFQVLVLRGKALLESQNAIQRIAADLAAAQQRISLHNDQKKRVNELKINLDSKPEDLDTVKIDLIGLSGQLLFFQRRMLMILASIVVLQDRALQYEYLRQPTPVGSFTLMSLQLAILRQSQSIAGGLTVQPHPEHQQYPIIYEIHGVRPQRITNNRRYTFNIDTNKREFAPFNYVRVDSVTVEIDGIVSTKSGKYYTELVFDGSPFFDRGFNGETLTFQTTSRIFTGLQKVKSYGQDDEPIVGDTSPAYESTTGQDPFDGKISNISPFSKWQVSLPQTQSNQDMKFDDHVIIRLIFRIYAQLKDTFLDQVDGSPETSPSTTVTKEVVLTMMSGKSVCAGWDVVFSMTPEQVNKQLESQFKNRQGNSKFVRETGLQAKEGMTTTNIPYKDTFEFKFNAPRLEFLQNNSNSARICLPIISGNWTRYLYIDQKWVTTDAVHVQDSDDSYILGNVDLAIVPGSVSNQHNVAIKLKGGHFQPQQFKAEISSPNLGYELTEYFSNLTEGYEVYNLGTLDFSQISTLRSLTPSNFLFHVLHTPSNRYLLQLFITTTGSPQSSTALYLKEPVPSNYECSLIVNSKIFFEDVLPESLGQPVSDFAVKGIAPESDPNQDKIWTAKVTAGSITSPFPERMVASGTRQSLEPKVPPTQWEAYVKVPNNAVVVDLRDMRFLNGNKTSGWDVRMNYDSTGSYPYQYGESIGIRGKTSSIFYHDHSLEVTLNMSTELPLNVTGSGQNQMVEFATNQSAIHLDGKLDAAGACKCNDRDLQKQFFSGFQKAVPPVLTNIFNQKFKSVSLFALKNLLFPAKNLIDIKEAYVPGDMVVFGNFTSPPRRKTRTRRHVRRK